MRELLEAQYKLVQGSRNVLLEYCSSVTPDHFVAENTGFGRGGSMRNLLVHIGNTYQYWLGAHALEQKMTYPSYESIATVQQSREYYVLIDALVRKFLEHFEGSYIRPVSGEQNGQIIIATPLEVFTHVCTHEFHHKGQILSISRQLGYTPVDTDIMR